jgi:hypothetical protein
MVEIKNESEVLTMKERIEQLEQELEAVCGTYEQDCSKCPKQKECNEYIHANMEIEK